MKWWGVLLLIFLFVGIVSFIAKLIRFRNDITRQKENIEKAKSRIRILKAKYQQVLRKVGTTQKNANDAQGGAYYTANKNGAGRLIGGALGAINSNFEEVSDLVESLAGEYQSAQQNYNELVNRYNVNITAFPDILFAKIFGYRKEKYIDFGNLTASTKLIGFDEDDV